MYTYPTVEGGGLLRLVELSFFLTGQFCSLLGGVWVYGSHAKERDLR